MNKKFLMAVAGVLAFSASKSQAQDIVFVADDTAYSHPEVLVHIPSATQDNVIMQNTSFTDSTAISANTSGEKKSENISYYAQKLNLSPEQMEKAQEINEKTHAEHKKILQSIEDLRQQAHELERKSLTDFEAILTPEQKNLFSQLQNEQNNVKVQADKQPEAVSESVPEDKAETTPEIQPETIPEPQPETIPEPQPEVIPEAQPEPVQEPQPEATPEVQQEPVQEPQPEVIPEAQPEPVQEPQPEVIPEVQPEPVQEPQPETLP